MQRLAFFDGFSFIQNFSDRGVGCRLQNPTGKNKLRFFQTQGSCLFWFINLRRFSNHPS